MSSKKSDKIASPSNGDHQQTMVESSSRNTPLKNVSLERLWVKVVDIDKEVESFCVHKFATEC